MTDIVERMTENARVLRAGTGGFPTVADECEESARTITDLRTELAKARKEALEEAAKAADKWSSRSEILLRCGEMTSQELRTSVSVAKGISAAIRALSREDER